jgi:hypothetical protein
VTQTDNQTAGEKNLTLTLLIRKVKKVKAVPLHAMEALGGGEEV